MNEAARVLFDYTDFTSFSKLHTDVKTNNCRIMHAEWTQVSGTEWVFTIKADRFTEYGKGCGRYVGRSGTW